MSILQPAPGDTGKPCGVDYELKVSSLSDQSKNLTKSSKAYVLEEGETEPNRKNNVRLVIRKVQFAPDRQAPQVGLSLVDIMIDYTPVHFERQLYDSKTLFKIQYSVYSQ